MMQMKQFGWFALASLASWGAHAQDASAKVQIRSLVASCASCHGTDGRPVEGSAVPALAGMPRTTLTAQMKAFKEGTRPATVMHQLSKGYTDDQIDRIATYFASVKR